MLIGSDWIGSSMDRVFSRSNEPPQTMSSIDRFTTPCFRLPGRPFRLERRKLTPLTGIVCLASTVALVYLSELSTRVADHGDNPIVACL